jgi:hypothetical protein
MECIALTGIFPQVIDELKKGIPRTVELTSAHNVISLTQVTPGSQIFLTTVDCEDVTVGDTGIVVEVISVAITMKHTVESGSGYHIMEREKLSARVKVKFLSKTTIRANVTRCSITEPRIVDVVRPVAFHAG